VAVRDFRDFVAWQLSYELKCEVFAFTAIGPAERDFKYRDQIRDSSPRLTATLPKDMGVTILESSQGFAAMPSDHWTRPRAASSTAAIARISMRNSFRDCGTSQGLLNVRRRT
jgi:hypothetical protein